MLDRLHKRHARVVGYLLSVVLTAERPEVAGADAHTEGGDARDQLRGAGYTEMQPVGTARDLCRQWADAGWLVRQVLEDDVEVYQLSAHAVAALGVAGRAGGTRARVSQSRVRTLLDAVDRLAEDADPDVLMRMARLDAEIARLRAELDHVQQTRRDDQADEETQLAEAENVIPLVRARPADFVCFS